MGIAVYKPFTLVRERTELLKRVEGLELHDRLICEASIKTPISQLPKEQTQETARKYFGALHAVIGLTRALGKSEADMLFRQVLKYYGYLSWTDLSLAFEFLGQGVLDPYLPRNGRGEADRAHYDRFSLEYFMRILTAYLKRKGKAWDTANKKALPLAYKHDPRVIAQYGSAYRDLVAQCFEQYKEHGTAPNFMTPKRVAEVLQDAGLALESDYTDYLESLGKAKALVASDKHVSRSKRAEMVGKVAQGLMNNLIGSIAERIQCEKVIKIAFDRAIENETDVRGLLCM